MVIVAAKWSPFRREKCRFNYKVGAAPFHDSSGFLLKNYRHFIPAIIQTNKSTEFKIPPTFYSLCVICFQQLFKFSGALALMPGFPLRSDKGRNRTIAKIYEA